MKKAGLLFAVLCVSYFGAAETIAQTEGTDVSYGDAVVSAVLRLDETITFYCNLENFPPLIGKNIPVKIKSLKQADTPHDNQKILVFLNQLLFSKNKPVSKIVLKDIQRGESFCLLAEIEADGRNLCDLLVEQNLARKIIEVKDAASAAYTTAAVSSQSAGVPQTQDTAITYVCSKSSKVYHRSTCPHAKRLDPSKTLTFMTAEEAAKTGRRPCKSCNP